MPYKDIEKRRANKRAYYWKHHDKMLALQKKAYKNNKKRWADYYQENKERINKNGLLWARANPDKVNGYSRKYKKANPNKAKEDALIAKKRYPEKY